MSTRFLGGIISATPPTVSTSSAPGVWSLEQALQYIKAGTWPLPSFVSDPYFKYVTMLLHGDGTNGAQNNTFLDSSTNNFTITRNGNTTQGSFSPYGSNWSNYFDGSSYLTVPANAAFNLTGNFTLEFWVNPWSNTGSGGYSLYFGAASGSGDYFGIKNGTNYIAQFGGSGEMSWSGVPTIGAWTHLALVRSGSTVTLYVNGVSAGTNTKSSTWIGSGSNVQIGAFSGAQFFTQAYISNLRLVNGTALYVGTFTPPTTPLTAISGTSLLTCQSNRFIDNSTNAFAITVNGSPSVQRFSPFSPSAAYSTSVIGGSGYFDGNGDYLTSTATTALNFGTSNFTIEFWAYLSSTSTNQDLFGDQNSSGGVGIAVNGNIVYYGDQGISNPLSYSYSGFYNQWVHIAVSRSSGTSKMFFNGVQVSTNSDSINYATSTGVIVGKFSNRNNYALGYISDVRVVKGTALYTAGFTPPTAPLTAITNTSLLTNFTNGAIFDNAMMNNLETVGNAQISTSVVKFGTGSMSFNGTNSGLTYVPLSLGAGDLTVEWWGYQNANLSYLSNDSVYAGEIFAGNSSGALGIMFYSSTQSVATNIWVYVYNVSTVFQPSISISLNQWNYFALTRSGGTWRLFVNGTQVGSTSSAAGTTNIINNKTIGWRNESGFSNWFPGYIDDLRITKGYARYTANFTPPTAAFPNQ